MPTNILMPALSPTMEKGNLSKWLKKEGDTIKSGDVIAEIETDKATMEVEAVDEGTLAKIVVPEGTADVDVNAVIGVIAAEGEDVKTIASQSIDAAPAAKAAPEAAPETKAEPATVEQGAAISAPQGLRGEREPANVPMASKGEETAARDAVDLGAQIFASPLARRIAKDGNLDLSQVNGSGPHGRIVERDVKAALASPRPVVAPQATAAAPAPVQAPGPKPAAASDETIKKMYPAGSFEELPHDSMRKTIARRLVEAKTTIPHFYLSVDCDLDALMALREQINAAAQKDKHGKPAYKVSVNDFVIKALALALIRVPEANVTWTEAAMLKHKTADIGVAVSIPGGLITPVIRAAETKTLSTISNEMKDYAARARNRKLKPEEYQGGTSAVSNLGMFGIKNFAAIVNPPHASILAVGAGEKRVVAKNGAPAVATVMTVTLSTDHRAVDGALGAELISAFRTLIENPMGMLV
ncbi:pyruvate dehydrogenase complex dihydrolipoamide acetyltransferase [Lichenihabitans psoromatis]|uniref:pyruvate dehydrogenase complex dihydrolipoamide acetyltransferase n=1 Tax=Lichenihabitans psoromatis TaxID=2528642 RepID=UPI0010358EA2|nr:pyruvate dehydrogenase complex dihydrolipoamide acetyltransferase [Lichenihabitans psoromatis]